MPSDEEKLPAAHGLYPPHPLLHPIEDAIVVEAKYPFATKLHEVAPNTDEKYPAEQTVYPFFIWVECLG